MEIKTIASALLFVALLACTGSLISLNAAMLDPGVDVQSSVALTISGGTSSNGRKTFILENVLDFGKVSFINPEIVSNGDAYILNETLHLEAILSLEVVMNGMDFANVQLSRQNVSTNPFHAIYYSLDTNRSAEPQKVLTEPRHNQLLQIRQSQSTPLRLVFEISPQQKGKIFDRLKMEAVAKP